MLTRNEISTAFAKWGAAWNAHDLDGVMDLFHDDIYFENWTGGWVRGKENLRLVRESPRSRTHALRRRECDTMVRPEGSDLETGGEQTR